VSQKIATEDWLRASSLSANVRFELVQKNKDMHPNIRSLLYITIGFAALGFNGSVRAAIALAGPTTQIEAGSSSDAPVVTGLNDGTLPDTTSYLSATASVIGTPNPTVIATSSGATFAFSNLDYSLEIVGPSNVDVPIIVQGAYSLTFTTKTTPAVTADAAVRLSDHITNEIDQEWCISNMAGSCPSGSAASNPSLSVSYVFDTTLRDHRESGGQAATAVSGNESLAG
jgi:hypothetical protein